MSVKELEAFLAHKEREEREWEHPDREAVKVEWLGYVRQFYDRVLNEWLSELIAAEKVAYEFQSMTLNEEHLGVYQIDTLVLRLADQEVAIEPIGRMVLGVRGRIDMEGVAGKVTFVLVDRDAKNKGTAIKANIQNIKDADLIEHLSADVKTSEQPLQPELAWKISPPPPSKHLIDLNEDTFSDALLEVLHG